MRSLDIFQNLKKYDDLLKDWQKKEAETLVKEKGFIELTRSLSSEYNFITLRLNCRSQSSSGGESERIYCQISFEIEDGNVVFKELYHENASQKDILEKVLRKEDKLMKTPWLVQTKLPMYESKEITLYLSIADEIAGVTSNCVRGDNYYPGVYSSVTIDDKALTLSQVNHMNSRSSDHKEDYSLRKLEFRIPLQELPDPNSRYDYTIGAMGIYFSDYSSKNNKSCGEAVLKKIEEVQANFKNE